MAEMPTATYSCGATFHARLPTCSLVGAPAHIRYRLERRPRNQCSAKSSISPNARQLSSHARPKQRFPPPATKYRLSPCPWRLSFQVRIGKIGQIHWTSAPFPDSTQRHFLIAITFSGLSSPPAQMPFGINALLHHKTRCRVRGYHYAARLAPALMATWPPPRCQ